MDPMLRMTGIMPSERIPIEMGVIVLNMFEPPKDERMVIGVVSVGIMVELRFRMGIERNMKPIIGMDCRAFWAAISRTCCM